MPWPAHTRHQRPIILNSLRTVDPDLSAKRREAGRLGAAARWGTRPVGHLASSNGNRAGNVPSARDHVRANLREGRRDWYRISNQGGDDGPALIDIYDEIGYWGVTAADFVADLRAIAATQIELHINSPGGDVYDGIAIYNALIDHPASVEVHVDALAASAASFIAQAGDRVVMNRASEMMIHDPWGLTVGNAEDHRRMAEDLDRVGDNIAGIYNERAGGGVKTWRARMRDETWYTAEEAVTAGLADEVHAGRKQQPPEDAWDLSVFAHAGRRNAPAPVIAGTAARRPPAAAATGPAAPDVDDGGSAGGQGGPPAEPVQPAGVASPTGATTSTGEDTTASEPEPPNAEIMAALDGIDLDGVGGLDPKSLHTAFLDAADEALDVDTTRLRAALEDDFDYTPDAFRNTLLDLVNQAPAPPPVVLPEPPAPRHIDIDDFTDAAREALSS